MNSPKIVVIMPAYNASKTIEQTFLDIPEGSVHECLVVDDFSADSTVEVARRLGLRVFLHGENQGYGGNQKTCYIEALKTGADIVVMLHPDYQYDPAKIPDLVRPILEGDADVVLGSRMAYAVAGGMPLYKRIANRFLTWCENKVFGLGLSEYHTGFRAFRRSFLETAPFLLNSNDFIFDQEIIAQAVWFKARIAEISVPHRYFPEASTINLWRSVQYGFGVLRLLIGFLLAKNGLVAPRKFRPLHHAYVEVPPGENVESARSAITRGAPVAAEDQTNGFPTPSAELGWFRSHRVELLLFVLLWTTYAYFYQSTQQNEAARFDQIRAIVQDQTLAINQYWWNSADVIHYPRKDGSHIYPNKAPGMTLLATVPFGLWFLSLKLFAAAGMPQWLYWHLVTYLTVIFTVSLVSALAGVAMYRIILSVSGDRFFSLMAVVAVWLGTMAFPFSTLFFSHQMAASLLVLAFYCLFQLRRPGDAPVTHPKRYLGVAGLLMGLSMATEYPTALLAGLLSLYAFWLIAKGKGAFAAKARLVGALAIGLLSGIAVLIAYNLAAFGKPFYIPYEAYSAANSPFATYSRGWLGMQWRGWKQFLDALASITLHPPIGLLYVWGERWAIYARNPVLWLALPGLVMMTWQRKWRAEGVLIGAMIVAYLLFLTSYGSSPYDWTGASYLGPRHLIPLLPFLALPLYFGARRLKWAFYPLLGLSIFYMLAATAIEPRVPYPFDNPARDLLAPEYLRGRFAQNTDSLFDADHKKLTKNSTAFNIAKLARIPGHYQLLPLMIWWGLLGSALLSATARTKRLGGNRTDALAPSRRMARIVLILFVGCIGLVPAVYHAATSTRHRRHGLSGKYYPNADWKGPPADKQTDLAIDFDWSKRFPMQPPFSAEWTGYLSIDRADNYVFGLIADDGASLEIDGKMIINLLKGPLLTKKTGTIHLKEGLHPVRVRYVNLLFGGSVKLSWSMTGRPEQIVPSEVLLPTSSKASAEESNRR